MMVKIESNENDISAVVLIVLVIFHSRVKVKTY